MGILKNLVARPSWPCLVHGQDAHATFFRTPIQAFVTILFLEQLTFYCSCLSSFSIIIAQVGIYDIGVIKRELLDSRLRGNDEFNTCAGISSLMPARE